jgi:type IV secretion system protein VirB10
MTEPTDESAVTPRVKDKTLRPSGLVPKNTQTWAVLGLGVVMILVIALSGNKTSPQTQAKTPGGTDAIDPNEARIQEYRNRIEEDARKLAAEKERLADTKQALGSAASQAITNTAQPPAGPINKKEKSPVELERDKREYQSLFASNIALSYRKNEIAGKEAAPSAGGSGQPMATLLQSPYGLLPAAMPALSAPQAQAAGQPAASKQETTPEGKSKTSDEKPDPPAAGQYRLLEGTVLETALTNRLAGSFSGPVNCVVTTDVYSPDGQHLLVPRGSRVLGEASKVEAFGQQRLAVAFHRLVMPDGTSVHLDRLRGLDQAGQTGLRDEVDNHYLMIFGTSLAVGALSGLTQYNTQYGLDVSSADVYRQGVSRSLGDSSIRILDRFMNILPTFTVREGYSVKIYLTADLDLPAYGRHLEKGEPK